MATKKDKEVKSKSKVAKKTTVKKSENVSTKAVVAKKTAISKLKSEVKKTKNVKDKKKIKATEEKQEDKRKDALSEVINKQQKAAVVLKINTPKKQQNKGKIGEINNNTARATGHRKRAIAKVICREKSGKLSIIVNGLDYKKFFTKLIHQSIVLSPFTLLQIESGYTVDAKVFGGGKSGQADAFKLGLSRCLSLFSEENAKILRKNSFLTRDARKVEPKKAGLKKARKKEQFSKR